MSPATIAAVAGAALLLSSCGPSQQAGASPMPAPDCRVARFPFPPPALKLTAEDRGRHARIGMGQLVAVTLLGNGSHWQPVELRGGSLLRLPNGAQTATVGTQLAELCAVARGTSELSTSNEQTTWNAVIEVH